MKQTYGHRDTTFQAVGGENGIATLVDTFYRGMEQDPRFQIIWEQHKGDRRSMRNRLASFLCGWMGGPRRYQEQFGQIDIPAVHRHLRVSEVERDLWLECMGSALDELDYPVDFKTYLLAQFAIPAERIRLACADSIKSASGQS